MLCVSLAAVLASVVASWRSGPYLPAPPVFLAFNLYALVGVGCAVRAAVHRGLDRRTRRAWGLVAAAYVLLGASDVLRRVYPGGVDFPSPADLLRLAAVPVLLAGLLVLPLRRQSRRERHKVWLDTGIVVVGSSMLLWYLDVGPSVAAAGRIPGSALAASIAYPALDLVLVFGAVAVLLRGAAASARVPAGLLVAGMLFVVAGDAWLGYRQSHGLPGLDRWQLMCWLTGHFLLAMAALVQCGLAGRHRLDTEEHRARSASNLPYLAIVLAYLLLLAATWGQQVRIVGLVLGAVAMTVVVVVRQIVALRENHELAVTDTLTGLANRRQLHDSLRLALTRGARNGQTVAALLLDMNGFKQVNDSLGHDAGDQLLVAFGQILRRNVLGMDVVGRLGGDEFAVILHNIDSADNARAVAHRIIADMRQPILIADTPIRPSAAIGIALAGPGRSTAEQVLRHADTAMYQAKQHKDTAVALYSDTLEHT